MYFDTVLCAVEGEEELAILGTSTLAHLPVPVTTADKLSVTSVKPSPIHTTVRARGSLHP